MTFGFLLSLSAIGFVAADSPSDDASPTSCAASVLLQKNSLVKKSSLVIEEESGERLLLQKRSSEETGKPGHRSGALGKGGCTRVQVPCQKSNNPCRFMMSDPSSISNSGCVAFKKQNCGAEGFCGLLGSTLKYNFAGKSPAVSSDGKGVSAIDVCMMEGRTTVPEWYRWKDWSNTHSCITQEMKAQVQGCHKQAQEKEAAKKQEFIAGMDSCAKKHGATTFNELAKQCADAVVLKKMEGCKDEVTKKVADNNAATTPSTSPPTDDATVDEEQKPDEASTTSPLDEDTEQEEDEDADDDQQDADEAKNEENDGTGQGTEEDKIFTLAPEGKGCSEVGMLPVEEHVCQAACVALMHPLRKHKSKSTDKSFAGCFANRSGKWKGGCHWNGKANAACTHCSHKSGVCYSNGATLAQD